MSTLVAANGDESSATSPMYIYIYPNTSAEDDECQDYIGPHLGNICGELYTANSIDYYRVVIRYEYPGQPDPNYEDFYYDFKDWLIKKITTASGEHISVWQRGSNSARPSMSAISARVPSRLGRPASWALLGIKK